MKANLFYCLFVAFLFLMPGSLFPFSLDDYPEGWSGDTDLFVWDTNEELLRLNAPEESGEAFLFCTSSAFEDAVWEMTLKMDFNPSSSNYMNVYLTTDRALDFQNGFYLVVGTTKDNISLWERCGGEDRLLIEGSEDLLDVSAVDVDVRVNRKKGGDWSLEVNTGNGWQSEGETISKFGFLSKFFGLSCHYTKTRSDKFYIGALTVSGQEYMDTIPPVIRDMKIVNGHTLNFTFSEAVSPAVSHPVFEGLDFVFPAVRDIHYLEDSSLVEINLEDKLPDLENGQLMVYGWCDDNGACMEDTALACSYLSPRITDFYAENYHDVFVAFNKLFPSGFLQPQHFIIGDQTIWVNEIMELEGGTYRLGLSDDMPDAKEIICFIRNLVLPDGDTVPEGPYNLFYHEAKPYDIVFSEIMHNPSPVVLLPDAEYVELYNRSGLPVNLKNMCLNVNDREIALPEHLLFPDEYVVLTGSQSLPFSNNLALDRWYALPNTGGELVLKNPSGTVIAAFSYPAMLDGGGYKQQGGWSMETVDADNLSGHILNWVYCINKEGGTPGIPNSVAGPNPDVFPPGMADAWLENDSVLILDFGEPMDMVSIEE